MTDTIIELIHPGDTKDQDEITQVYAERYSTGQNEFAAAGQAGFKSSVKFRIWTSEYDEQPELIHNNKRLTIYRTFERDDGKTELYAAERVGNK